jgi:hypothetical protein
MLSKLFNLLKPKRFRNLILGHGSFLVVLLYLFADPDSGILAKLPFGATTVATFLILLKALVGFSLIHLGRKALFDYLDLKEYTTVAKRTPIGAGLVVLSVGVTCIALSIVIHAVLT